MKPGHKVLVALVLLALASCGRAPQTGRGPAKVRVAIIGGMVMSGLWGEVSAAFTRQTGIPVELVATGPKEILDAAVRAGEVDLVTMHSSDTASNLVADGLGTNMRPWAHNELVILGPPGDPAGIRGFKSGMEALKTIAAKQAPFVEARNVGSQTVEIHLWRKAGITPRGSWLIADGSPAPQQVVEFAAKRGAYVIVGRIPVLCGKILRQGMEIMVEGDPEMQRPYVVIEANPGKFPGCNASGARRLADFLTSASGQIALRSFAASQNTGLPLFYPISDQAFLSK